MDSVRMIFRRDRGTGMPRLEVHGARLTNADVRALEREIRIRFEQLVRQGNGSVVTFQTPVGEFSHPFRCRVSVTNGADTRCPELAFELLTPNEQHTSSVQATRNWPRQFLRDIQRLFPTDAMARLNPTDRIALDRVIAELRVLIIERPQVLPFVLVAGYLVLGQQRAACYGNGANRFLLGARGFNTLFATDLSEPTLRNEPSPAPRTGTGRIMPALESIGRLLERLCGMSEPSN